LGIFLCVFLVGPARVILWLEDMCLGFVFKVFFGDGVGMSAMDERPVLVVCALEDEVFLFGRSLEGREVLGGLGRQWWRGRCGGVLCVAGHVGVGAENAREAAGWAVDFFSPCGVLLGGYGGGLSGDVGRGDVVSDDARVVAVLGGKARLGKVVCVPKVLESEAEKREWAARTGALVCEMESDGVRSVCGDAGVEFFHVRVVSDAVGDDFPEGPLAMACDFRSGRTTPLRLLWHLLRCPRDVGAVVEIAKKVAPVRRRLCEVLRVAAPEVAGVCAGRGG
jgi:nucleoside phosphorylase